MKSWMWCTGSTGDDGVCDGGVCTGVGGGGVFGGV